ncbi:chromosome segregation protein SMC [Aggregicoccus sp. 17bor-14]|uniref:chromosome segregation protein SMC n=1 Tax=Myxococcaceae TaxID=31 RepID=UPI00129C703B|nr:MULTISPECIES: chromosome segregation protein SMC [Myxococcaceae]MBF5044429.1 chromosome segregation protein SMC [Simulacricoccus sp. 17bor-14]MRI90175.1 chromosome segregation protein SMC [Aggregicoccus sp. 17bor-14]
MRPRLLLLLPLALLIAACAKRPSASPANPAALQGESAQLTREVQGLSSRAEALLERQDDRVWAYWTEGTQADVGATYAQDAQLFSLASLRKIDRLRQLSTAPREVRALTYLESLFAGEYLASALEEQNDAVANLEGSLSYTLPDPKGGAGREVRYRDLERLLANERSAEVRRALYRGATPSIERLNQSLRRREERLQAVVRQLGYPSYVAFSAELRQADLDRLAALAEEILQATQAPYLTVMTRLAKSELGLSFEQLTRADIPRLFRPREVDSFFPRAAQLTRVDKTLAGLGIQLSALPNVRVDARELPRKNPRPLTLAPKVPGDVRLSVRPADGVLEQARVLHEVGHLLHAAFTREPRFELAKLGNPTVGEAWAALFEDLVEDPVWLEEQAGLTDVRRDTFLAASSAHRLFLIRRAAGRLLYQLELRRRGDKVDARALYSAILQRTDALPMGPDDEARYLVDLEDFFQSADAFRAWFLAGQLQGQLKARFGPAWWHSAEAGKFLEGLWAHGNALSARELALAAGERGIEPDVLLLRLGTTLGVPIRLGTPAAGSP